MKDFNFVDILLIYLMVGVILGFIAVHKYKKFFGYCSSAASIMIPCCILAWPLVFPDMMNDLRRAKKEREAEESKEEE